MTLLRLENVSVTFAVQRGFGTAAQLRAVRDVSFDLDAGATLALVGESGCGKSTLGRAILRLAPISAGRIIFDGVDNADRSGAKLRALRRKAQMVFQDPIGSLNPRLCIEDIVAEGLDAHGLAPTRAARRERVADLLRQVGLTPDHSQRFPHEFSGGQRQRIAIARALAVSPRLLICDEPTSALDVSIRGQIVNLLLDLRERLGLTLIMITHDLTVARQLCDRVAVMYAGRIVESGPLEAVFQAPRHPYTEALLRAAPTGDPARRGNFAIPRGEPPSPLCPPTGCAFHPRCPRAITTCSSEEPPLVAIGGDALRQSACPVTSGAAS